MTNALKVFFLISVLFGSVNSADLVWTLADIGVGSMSWINIIAIILLSSKAFDSLKDYEGRLK